MLAAKKLYLGHRRCNVREELNVNSCFTCYRYGHRKDSCKSEGIVCRKCCEVGHVMENCTSQVTVCINCRLEGRPHNHVVLSRECTLQQELGNKERARISYV